MTRPEGTIFPLKITLVNSPESIWCNCWCNNCMTCFPTKKWGSVIQEVRMVFVFLGVTLNSAKRNLWQHPPNLLLLVLGRFPFFFLLQGHPAFLSVFVHPEANYHSWILTPRSSLQKNAEKCTFLQKNAVFGGGGGHMAGNRRKSREGFGAQESRTLVNLHKIRFSPRKCGGVRRREEILAFVVVFLCYLSLPPHQKNNEQKIRALSLVPECKPSRFVTCNASQKPREKKEHKATNKGVKIDFWGRPKQPKSDSKVTNNWLLPLVLATVESLLKTASKGGWPTK